MPRAAAAVRTVIPGCRRPAPRAAAAGDGASWRTRVAAPDEDDLGGCGPVPVVNSGAGLGGEPRRPQRTQPGVAAERPEPVRFRDDPDGAFRVAQGELVLGQDPAVTGNGVGGPLAEACLAAGAVVAAAAPGARPEGLGCVIGRKNGQAAGAAVGECRADDAAQV